MKLPKVRTENLLEQNLENETLIYDLTIDKAFNLNETSTIVYKACGQNATFDKLKRQYKFTDDFIFLALDELKKHNLLIGEYVSPFANTNRREVIKRIGLATMAVLPIITGLVAPKAVNAASSSAASVCAQSGSDLNESCDDFAGGGRKSNGCFCRSGPCFSTNSGDACCTPQDGLMLRSGTTFNSDAPYYSLIGPDATAPACSDGFRCCDGSQTPYGTCSYVSQIPYEGNDPQYQGLFLAGVMCSCSCP